MNDYLYHYTTLEKLALILASKKIRFNPLTSMDDKQEAMTSDQYLIGKYTFVSSWTNDSKENIAMWNLYSDSKSGVRIGLKRNPFKRYRVNKVEINPEYPDLEMHMPSNDIILPINECIGKEYYLTNLAYDNVLEQVIYTDDETLIFPKTIEIGEESTTYISTSIGKYKNIYWSFQNEERYMLKYAPVGLEVKAKYGDNAALMFIDNLRLDKPFKEAVYLTIDDCAYERMIVTVAPEFTQGNRVILEALKEMYNRNMQITDSVLTGNISF